MCNFKKYGILFILLAFIIYFAMWCFAYCGTQKEYIKKHYKIILWEKNNSQYIFTSEIINGRKYETFWIYDETNTPITLNVPIENIKFITCDTISDFYIDYISQYIKKSNNRLFKDKCVNMYFENKYAIVYIPKNYTITFK